MFSEDSCAALALFSHYFHLSQFFWMLIQVMDGWAGLDLLYIGTPINTLSIALNLYILNLTIIIYIKFLLILL